MSQQRRAICISLVVTRHGIKSADIPRELADSVGHLVLNTPYRRTDYVAETSSTLVDLLSACRNLNSLHVTAYSLSGVAKQLRHSFPRLRDLYANVIHLLTEDEFSTWLQLMPHVERISLLPRVSRTHPSQLAERIQPFHLRELKLQPYNVPVLSLLNQCQWTTRTLSIRISRATWDHLVGVDWACSGLQHVADLSLVFVDLPAVVLSLIAACCGLRRLQLMATAHDMRAVVPGSLRMRGLRVLQLRVLAPERAHLRSLADAIVDGLRSQKTPLRNLEILMSDEDRFDLCEDVRQACSARRIVCTVGLVPMSG